MPGYLPLLADPVLVNELAGDPAPYIAYGFQKLVPSYSGALCTLRESVGNTSRAFYPLENGLFPVLQALAFQGAGNLFVVTWNDQSGNGFDVKQATAALQPQLDLVHAALGNRPAIGFTDQGSARLTTSGSPASIFGAGGFFSCVADFTANPSLVNDRIFTRTNLILAFTSTNSIAPQLSQTASGAWGPSATIGVGVHVLDILYSSASIANVATFGVDGVNPAQTNLQPSSITAESGTLTVGNLSTGGAGFPGYLAEMLFFRVQPTTDGLASLRARQKADFGTP